MISQHPKSAFSEKCVGSSLSFVSGVIGPKANINKRSWNIMCLRKTSFQPPSTHATHPPLLTSSRIGQVWVVNMLRLDIRLRFPLLVVQSQNRSVPFGNVQVLATISWTLGFKIVWQHKGISCGFPCAWAITYKCPNLQNKSIHQLDLV